MEVNVESPGLEGAEESKNKNNYNGHRANKKPVQAFLTEDERDLLESVKTARGWRNNKTALMSLLREEQGRLVPAGQEAEGVVL